MEKNLKDLQQDWGYRLEAWVIMLNRVQGILEGKRITSVEREYAHTLVSMVREQMEKWEQTELFREEDISGT